ncbi:MAG: DUF2231 domain-containing protein [Weeksellaceae bacterium]|nr:DUF2231 domain-containing protein [Weeksellaceae bacterium]
MFTPTHLHAMIVHFPIALLIFGFFTEVIHFIWKKKFFADAAFFLLLFGSLGSLAAYISGNLAGEGMEEGSLEAAIETHEQAAMITVILAVVTLVVYIYSYWKKAFPRNVRIIGLVFFAATVITVARTGYLGGQLVYKHAAGVELGLPNFQED